ncbi:hypothetical protein B0H14DRAFT_3538753 [Mycena olivaceomarginata]|nr:hypothetical protein B0H14DRAFT_3538753 [Mycena olivaceomarginata]
MSPARSEGSGDEGLAVREEIRNLSDDGDSVSSNEDYEMAIETLEAKQNEPPFAASLDSVNVWTPRYRTLKEALDDLAVWAPSVIEYDPKKPAYDPLSWNADWAR